MDILGKVEAYLPEGKVEYDIEDGEVFSEEDYDSLMEQGAFDDEDEDDDEHKLYNQMREMILNKLQPQPKQQPTPPKSKSRKVRRKLASQSRKINRSK